ncbi:MAG: type II toxin-antitoxin system Phd/YefM family antitoxin [Acidobacteria bacterium]|nr:type II toxin-antitoxin system Phd/YefM family antitoxin [Acidobacteriota bacterium]
MATAISAQLARSQLGSLLKQAAERRARFVITRSGKPTAVLLSISDFDDMLEELDPLFRRSLAAAAKEYRSGKALPLSDYLRARRSPARCRA